MVIPKLVFSSWTQVVLLSQPEQQGKLAFESKTELSLTTTLSPMDTLMEPIEKCSIEVPRAPGVGFY